MMIYQIRTTESQFGTTSNIINLIYNNKAIATPTLIALMPIIIAIGCFAFDESLDESLDEDTGDIKKYTIISISLILFLLLSIISMSAILLLFTEGLDDLIKVLSNSNFIAALIGSWVGLIGYFVFVFFFDNGSDDNNNLFAVYMQGGILKDKIADLSITKKILSYTSLFLLIILASSILSMAIYSSSLLDPTWYFSLIAFAIVAVIIVGGALTARGINYLLKAVTSLKVKKNKEITGLEAANIKLKTAIVIFKEEIKDLKGVNINEQATEELETKNAQAIEELETKNAQAIEELEAKDKAITDLEMEKTTLEEKIESLTETNTTNKQDISNLTEKKDKEIKDLKAAKDEAIEELEAKDKEIVRLKAEIEDLAANKKATQELETKNAQEITDLKAEIESLKVAKTTLEETIKSLETENTQAIKDLKAENARTIEGLTEINEKAITDLETEIDRLKAEIDRLETKGKQDEEIIKDLKAEKTTLEGQIKGLTETKDKAE